MTYDYSSQFAVGLLHAQIHHTNKGCCCPALDIFCERCPQHHDHAPPLIDAQVRIAQLEARLAGVEGEAVMTTGGESAD